MYIWSRYLNVTDGQTTCYGNTELCLALRVKNYCKLVMPGFIGFAARVLHDVQQEQ